MPLRVISKTINDTFPIRRLRKGQVAQIMKCDESEYIGEIVICHSESIRGITFPGGWSNIPRGDNFRVQVLPNGTKFEVCNNE